MVASRMSLLAYLLGASQLFQSSCALPTEQAPLRVEDVTRKEHNGAQAAKQRPLYGRFLHMTGTRAKMEQLGLARYTNMLQISTPIASTRYTRQLLKMPRAITVMVRLAYTAPKSAIATAPSR